MIRSPFYIQEDFISPLRCEQLIEKFALKVPDRNAEGAPLKHHRVIPSDSCGDVRSELAAITPIIEQRYDGVFSAEPMLQFQQYFENPKVPAEPHMVDGFTYQRKKWTKMKNINLVGIVWLKSYHSSVPLDPRYETYGGKLEFPSYNFSLTPVRGTLVVFPATEHFVNATSHVLLGSLEQIKITIPLQQEDGSPWRYIPANYPGSFQEWFLNE